MPSVDGTTNDGLTIAQQRMPDFTAYAQYGWNSKSHLRVGGLIRSMTYTDAQSDKAHAVTGFGVQASATFNLGRQWQVFGQATYGKGIGQYLNDISNLNVDIVPDPDNEGKMQALPMLAGMQACNTTSVRRCSFRAHTACRAFIPKTAILPTKRIPTVTGNIS